jgi:hypothetical protein
MIHILRAIMEIEHILRFSLKYVQDFYWQSNFGSVNAKILHLFFRCYCHNMFRSYDHYQAADSGVLSQAVCLTAIAVSWICGVASCCVCIIITKELWVHQRNNSSSPSTILPQFVITYPANKISIDICK